MAGPERYAPMTEEQGQTAKNGKGTYIIIFSLHILGSCPSLVGGATLGVITPVRHGPPVAETIMQRVVVSASESG